MPLVQYIYKIFDPMQLPDAYEFSSNCYRLWSVKCAVVMRDVAFSCDYPRIAVDGDTYTRNEVVKRGSFETNARSKARAAS